MDYVNRTSVNHPLIITFGFAMAWLAATGFWLPYRTMWQHDLAAAKRQEHVIPRRAPEGEHRKSAKNLDCAGPRFTVEARDTRLRPCASIRGRGAAPGRGRSATEFASAVHPPQR